MGKAALKHWVVIEGYLLFQLNFFIKDNLLRVDSIFMILELHFLLINFSLHVPLSIFIAYLTVILTIVWMSNIWSSNFFLFSIGCTCVILSWLVIGTGFPTCKGFISSILLIWNLIISELLMIRFLLIWIHVFFQIISILHNLSNYNSN